MRYLKIVHIAFLGMAASFSAGAQIRLRGMDTITGARLERQLLGKDSVVWLQNSVEKPATFIMIPAALCQPGTYQLIFNVGVQPLSATILMEKGALGIDMLQNGDAISPLFSGNDSALNTAYNGWKAREFLFQEDYRRYAQLSGAYKNPLDPLRLQLHGWWIGQMAAWEAYKTTVQKQWARRPLSTMVASTWGNYYAGYPQGYWNQLVEQLPLLTDLRYNANLIEGKDEEYLQLLFSAPPKNTDELTDTLLTYLPALLNKSIPNDSLLRYWCYNIRKQARNAGLDEVQELVDVRYLSTSCTADGDTDLQQRLAAYKNTRKGMLAPPIAADGFDLYRTITTDSTLVVFWASWCPHCQEELPRLYGKLANDGKIQVVAVGLDDSEAAWQAAKKQFPLWHHVRAPKKWDDSNVLPYGIYATPTLFLLDKSKHISSKFNSIDDFLKVIPHA